MLSIIIEIVFLSCQNLRFSDLALDFQDLSIKIDFELPILSESVYQSFVIKTQDFLLYFNRLIMVLL